MNSVLITGGNGSLGTILREGLPSLGWRVRSLGRQPLEPTADHIVGSVTDPETMRRAVEGMDAVVHLGGLANPGFEWSDYLEVNINGTRTVLEAARAGDVRRVVLASSNHAAGYHKRGDGMLAADAVPRPDSLYGVSKAAIEALGSYYADEFGLQTTSLRIGSSFAEPGTVRALSSWLSYPDFVRLVQAALVGPWSGHRTVWGVSANTRRWWSLDETQAMGYEPRDNAELFADQVSGEDSTYVGGSAPPYPNQLP